VNEDIAFEFGLLPPAFLPFERRRLFEKQVDFLNQLCDHIVLTIPESFVPNTTDVSWLEKHGVELRPLPEDLSLGESIAASISSDTSGHAVYLVHGDTLLMELLDFPLDAVSVAKKEDSYRWGFFEGEVLSGYFSFSSGSDLKRAIATSDGDFLRAIALYGKSRKIRKIRWDKWLDFGHLQNLHQATRLKPETRFFNQIQVDGGTVTKTGTDLKKLSDEAGWFEELPLQLRLYTPPFLGRTKGGYTLGLETNPTLHELFIFGELKASVWEAIAEAVFDFLKTASVAGKGPPQSSKSNGGDSLEVLTHTKTLSRLRTWAASCKSDLSAPWLINGVKAPSLFTLFDFASAVISGGPRLPGVMHGDLCFTNIFFDFHDRAVRVIDPRGSVDSISPSVYGDQIYDLAKLNHSINGYDEILAGNFFLEQSSTNALVFELAPSPAREEVQKAFAKYSLRGYGVHTPVVRATTIMLFLSMLPLHEDRPDRQLAFIANAYRLLSEWDDYF